MHISIIYYIELLSYENLVDFNEARMYETTMKLHTNPWILSRLSLASVDGKQHLSEAVFSALIGFSLQGKWRVPGRTHTPRTCCLQKQWARLHENYNPWWRVLRVRMQPGTRRFPYTENPTRALNITSRKCCLISTDAIDRLKKFTNETFLCGKINRARKNVEMYKWKWIMLAALGSMNNEDLKKRKATCATRIYHLSEITTRTCNLKKYRTRTYS